MTSIIYAGKKYHLHKRRNEYRRDERKDGKRNQLVLHRVVWENEIGIIPHGFHIHHIDGNHANNEIDNLRCLSNSEHISLHIQARVKQPGHSAMQSGASKKGWLIRKTVKKECQHCSKEYETKMTQSKWCSRTCKQKNYMAKKVTI